MKHLFSLLSKLKTETSVGLLILISGGVFIYSSILVTGWESDKTETYELHAFFENVAGLSEGTVVRVAGIKVGSVEEVELIEGRARVTMSIYTKYPMRKNSVAAIKSLGVLGDKYVELRPGSQNDALLQDGDQIDWISPGADLDSLIDNLAIILNDVKNVTGALSNSIGGKKGEEKLNQIFDDIQGFTKNLNQITSTNQKDIRLAIQNLALFTKDLKEISQQNKENIQAIVVNFKSFSGDLKEFMQNNKERLDDLVYHIDSASEKLDNSLTNIESISGKIDRGEGTIGKLVNDEETVESLNETLEGLNTFITSANKTKLDIGFSTEYLTKQNYFKSYLDINIKPVRDHYYTLQLVDNPRGKKTSKTTETETTIGGTTTEKKEVETETQQTFTFSAFINQRYFDTEFKIGLMESTFGVGIHQYFGKLDQLKLFFEAFDFSRDDNEGAHYKVGTYWKFYENLYVVAGADDFLNSIEDYRDYYVGFGISFNEDYLKLLSLSNPSSLTGSN